MATQSESGNGLGKLWEGSGDALGGSARLWDALRGSGEAPRAEDGDAAWRGEDPGTTLIENLQREDLNALDQARGLLRLQREFNLSQEELGLSVGKSRSTVTNLLRLLTLSSEVQSMLEDGKLEMGHARSLLTLGEEEQLQCAKRVVAESLSVRECEAMVGTLSGAKKTSNKSKTNKDPNTISLERELSEILGSPVEIKHNQKGKGKLIVSFKNLDTLQGVLDKIKS